MYSAENTIWVLLSAILMFVMQAGFAMLETGFTQAKNAGNIAMKNLLDFAIGSLAFSLVGFWIMFGTGNGAWLSSGGTETALRFLPAGVPLFVFLAYQTMFCATAATIASGAMAGRTKFVSYCVFSLILSMLIYPTTGHWIWGGGWLQNLGFHDFAGSTAVHLVGGAAAFSGALLLGPRTGKYAKDGKTCAIPGQSATLSALGVFLLWFGWFGFNAGSTFGMDSDGAMTLAGKIVVNTNVSAAAAAVTAVVYTGIRNKRADIPLTLNAVVAGLVSITAGCDMVTPSGAILIGMGAGILSIAAMEFIEKRIKVDDPVGAVSVHGVCGFYGTVMVGLLSAKEGLLYTGDFRLLVTQLVGVCCVSAFVFAVTAVVFWLIKIIFGLRVSGKAEQEGLDKAEHGLVVADLLRDLDLSEAGNAVPNLEVYAEKIPPFAPSPHKLTKVTIVINRDRFEALKAAMNSIGVTGMTVANVFGCGVQKGMPETYRGVELPMRLLPKVQVDIVVTKVPVEDVVSVAEQVLRTGHIGDGKIFISDIQNVVKVRTGERDYDALQGLG